MMKQMMKWSSLAALALSILMTTALVATADHGGNGDRGNGDRGNGIARDVLSNLKRAITSANAPALTTQQETDIKALINAYRDAQVDDDEDTALEAARTALDTAILAGNAAGVQTATQQIATREAELHLARLRAAAKLQMDILANLKTGGQLTLLQNSLGAEKLLSLVRSLTGHGAGGPGRR